MLKGTKDSVIVGTILAVVLALIAFGFYADYSPKKSKSVANQMVSEKQNGNANEQRTTQANRHIPSGGITPVAGDGIGKAKSNSHYYKDEGKEIDCHKATGFSDLVACESLNTQNSIDGSTKGIRNWTIASAISAFLALIAGIVSIILLRKANRIAVKSSRMSSMAVCDIFVSAPLVFSTGGTDETNIMLNYEIVNSGNSPAVDVSINFKVVGISEARDKTFPSRNFRGFYGELFKGKPPTLRGIIYPTAIPSEEIMVPSAVSEGKRANPFNSTLSSSLNTELDKGDICVSTQILYHSLSYSEFTITACKTFKLIPTNENRTQFLLKVVPDLSWLDDGSAST